MDKFLPLGAKELRGENTISPASEMSADMVAGMSTELLLDFIAMRFQGTDHGDMQCNFNLTITGVEEEKAALIVRNGAVTTRVGDNTHLSDNVTANVSLNKAAFEALAFSNDPVEVIDNRGEGIEISIIGDGGREALKEFFTVLDKPSYWFNIVTP